MIDIATKTAGSGAPRALFDAGIRGLCIDLRNHYVVTKDGEDVVLAPITVVMNWEPPAR